MPSVQPKWLRPYTFHGVELTTVDGQEQAWGECPFCGKDKFSVNSSNGLWDCKVCGEKGNVYTFLRQIWALSNREGADYTELALDRHLLHPSTLNSWGCCYSVTTREWIIPGYGPDGNINQLYRYVPDPATGKKRLLAVPGLTHQLHGVNLFHPNRNTVYICEGPWDGMALWEALRCAKPSDAGGLVPTGAEQASLLATSNVLAVPGCNVFQESWATLCAGKQVVLMFDSDHPRDHGGKQVEPAGLAGMRRVAQILARAAEPPSEIHYLAWSEAGYDPNLPSGYDVRDYLSGGKTTGVRVGILAELLGRIGPIPEQWVEGRTKEAAKRGGTEIELAPCTSWVTLELAWQKAMKWHEGLSRALSVMLASIISTKAVGDQLWVKIIGPAACGKSTLCEALSVARRYVFPKDTLTGGLVSGYQVDREGSENLSTVEKLRDKTLVINDGDTLLQLPNLNSVLSQMRAFYGRNLRSQYGNKMSTDHEGINCTVIICGTSSLHKLDSSELGERFLDCWIMDKIDIEQEKDILTRVAYRADRNVEMESGGNVIDQHDPDLIRAMQLTGGYVEYLRSNARQLLSQIRTPDWALQRCIALGRFVAYMRARPSTTQNEMAEREFAARLVAQHVRLAKCLAAVLGRKEADQETMARVKSVALDTARGRTLDITKQLYRAGIAGLSIESLAMYTNQAVDKEKVLCRFLRQIGVTETFSTQAKGLSNRPRWRLTQELIELYAEVMEETL